MTRKDYTLIAYRLAFVEPEDSEEKAHAAWAQSCSSIARGLEIDNPRFDKRRFLAACQFEYWKNRKSPQ